MRQTDKVNPFQKKQEIKCVPHIILRWGKFKSFRNIIIILRWGKFKHFRNTSVKIFPLVSSSYLYTNMVDIQGTKKAMYILNQLTCTPLVFAIRLTLGIIQPQYSGCHGHIRFGPSHIVHRCKHMPLIAKKLNLVTVWTRKPKLRFTYFGIDCIVTVQPSVPHVQLTYTCGGIDIGQWCWPK